MVKLHVSLLVLTFATGSVLASSDKYEQRDLRHTRIGIVIPTTQFQSRGFDDDQDRFERDLEVEEFSGREYLLDVRDTFDDLEARQPSILGAFSHLSESAVKGIAKSKLSGVALGASGPGKYAKVFKVGTTAAKIGQKAKVGKIGGKLESKLSRKAADILGHTKLGQKVDSKVRQKATAKAARKIRQTVVKQVKDAASSDSSSNQQQSNNNNKAQERVKKYEQRLEQDIQRVRKDIAQANRYLPANLQVHVQSRALEDDEDLPRRNLDAEALFGRNYDLLDERDTFDDLD